LRSSSCTDSPPSLPCPRISTRSKLESRWGWSGGPDPPSTPPLAPAYRVGEIRPVPALLHHLVAQRGVQCRVAALLRRPTRHEHEVLGDPACEFRLGVLALLLHGGVDRA
jgi:hypothetical protein